MPDLTAISAAFQSLKTVTGIVKSIRQSSKSLESASINYQLADLTDVLADIKLALADVKEENFELRGKVSELNQVRNYRAQLTLRENVYFPKYDEIEGYGEGPWCTKCFDEGKVLVSLHHKVASSYGGYTYYKWECPSCKSNVNAPKKA